ncbi:MAG: hypothetical protein WB511_07090 [Nitrososphaeraceae archaeon]|jgi:hypothetical protein
MVEKTFQSVESYTPDPEKNSRFCIKCSLPATKTVKFAVEGAIVLERYCDDCSKVIEYDSTR